MHNIETIKKNYKKFSDTKVEYIALNESKSLRKEVLIILKEEIKQRGLNENLITWVDTETDSFEGEEREALVVKIQNLPCPKCNEKKDKLYGFEINKVISFVFLIEHSQLEKILCMPCGRQEKLYTILTTLFAGWWSRTGILVTPFTVIKDSLNFLFIHKISDRILNQLIDTNTGYFRRVGTETDILTELINQVNKKNEEDGGEVEFDIG